MRKGSLTKDGVEKYYKNNHTNNYENNQRNNDNDKVYHYEDNLTRVVDNEERQSEGLDSDKECLRLVLSVPSLVLTKI